MGLARHPLRSFLVFLTFALGAASCIVTIAAVEGGRRSIINDLEGLGVDVIAALNPIRMGPVSLGDPSAQGNPIEGAMVADLQQELSGRVRAVIPFRMELATVTSADLRVTTSLMITSPDFAGVLRSGVLAGRFLEKGDSATQEPVPVVLDEALARQFSAEEPESMVGEELDAMRVGQPFKARVVGIMKDPISLRRHLDAFDANKRARNITARRLEFKNLYVLFDAERDKPSGVLVQVASLDDIDGMQKHLEEFFEQRQASPFFFVQKLWIDTITDIVNRFSSLAHFINSRRKSPALFPPVTMRMSSIPA